VKPNTLPKTIATSITVRINIHKENVPIRPVVSKIHVTAYQRGEFLRTKVAIFYNCVTYLLRTILYTFNNLKINAANRLITPYINNLYWNLTVIMILHISKTLSIFDKVGHKMSKQTVLLFCTTFTKKKNHFQIENSIFKPMKGVVPISSVVAEIFLQHYEKLIAKYMIPAGYVILYNKHFYYILMNFYCRKTTTEKLNYTNNISNCM